MAAISPPDLIALLRQVRDGHQVEPNAVGNLAICDAEGVFVGYVSLRSQEVCYLDEGQI